MHPANLTHNFSYSRKVLKKTIHVVTTTSVFIPLLYCEQSTKYKPEFKLLPDLTQCTTESVFSVKSEAGIISDLPHRRQNRVRNFKKSQVWYNIYIASPSAEQSPYFQKKS